MYTMLYVGPHPLVATFVAVTVSPFLGTEMQTSLRSIRFPQFLHILFDVLALKALADRGCIESLKVYISFPVNALDILL